MKLITLKEDSKNRDINLIMVHLNKARCETYFWHWSSNHGDWVRGEEITSDLKRHYRKPITKSNYK